MITTDVELVKREMEKVALSDKRISEEIESLQATLQVDEERAGLRSLVEARRVNQGHQGKLIQLIEAQNLDDGGAYLIKDMLPAQSAYLAAIQEFARMRSLSMERFGVEATQTATTAKVLMISLAAAAAVLAITVAVTMTRSITGPISQAVRVAETVASRDLTSQIRVDRSDEAGKLLSALKRMNSALVNIVNEVRESSESIATGSSQIASGNSDLSRRTENQASNLQLTSASIEQISATVRHSAEAARAGSQGKGFSVVADEVQTLAQRAAAAAKDIRVLTEESTAKVDLGSKLVGSAGDTMAEIVRQVQHVSQLIGEIDAATQGQTEGMAQIRDAVAHLDQITQQNSALVEESAAAAESLNQQATRLTAVVGAFKLS